jgi:hypothetical protein
MSIPRTVMWGELKGMRKVQTVEQMPAQYRRMLLKIPCALASTGFASFGARRIGDLVSDPRYQDLAAAGPAQAQKAVDKCYPHALDTFGAASSKFSDLSVAYGIRRRRNEELRQVCKPILTGRFGKQGSSCRIPRRGVWCPDIADA